MRASGAPLSAAGWCRTAALALGAPVAADQADERDIIRLVAALDGASEAERATILQQLALHGDAAVDVLLESRSSADLETRELALGPAGSGGPRGTWPRTRARHARSVISPLPRCAFR